MSRDCEKSGPRMSHAERAERRRQMALDVKEGASLAAVALRYQVTLPTVRCACQEHEVRWQSRPAK
ncbi:MAG TPA: hypothetical protein VG826_04150 [Pirellulales bacterium]|nr:hypothetical protein [Pirellulales bacterium]